MRFLLLTAAASLLLTACGGESEASDADAGICADQAADLRDVRALAGELSQPDSRWGPGGPDEATATVGDAVTALAGYVPEGDQLTRVVDRARDAVQALHDDLEDDDTLEGDGQSAATAEAALKALGDACG